MNILVIGLNHKIADVEVREKLAFQGEKGVEGLMRFRELPGIDEAMILSTCNRVELYANVHDVGRAAETIKSFLAAFHSLARDSLERSLYVYEGVTAVRHIFRVAASLDSMVIGEPQILGQLKDAFESALSRKTTGTLLNRVMKKAISVAKRVRTETKIAENAVSISFAAVELAKKIFTDLSKRVFLLLGAGEMAELAAKHLISNGVREVLVSNRTFERACELARDFQGRAVRFDEFISELARTDIIICSTGAPHYILTKEQMQKVMKERKQRPVFIIDISVPRNIDPAINDLENVYLYNVDDLQGVVDSNLFERKREAEKAEKIIDEEVETFLKWWASLDSVPTIIALREKAEEIRKEELEKLFGKIQHIGPKEREAIEYMATALMNKLIHPPTAALKEDVENKEILVATIRRLYGINGERNEE